MSLKKTLELGRSRLVTSLTILHSSPKMKSMWEISTIGESSLAACILFYHYYPLEEHRAPCLLMLWKFHSSSFLDLPPQSFLGCYLYLHSGGILLLHLLGFP
eukprot:TRINITY_DN15744_c0_g1_i1.p1 TRINITY_DN15744_c0_g1~~TRINITY_DN15744_c0_g1_i1.p1  ORF type:complete len:102 (+),score=10.71 TRINITY_DN15744_c0_g1_i1:331-636(+)